MRRGTLIWLVTLVASGLVAGQGPGPRYQGRRAAQPLPPPPPIRVQLSAEDCEAAGIRWAPAELRECPCVLKAVGKIRAPLMRTAKVSHFLPGRIAAIHVAEGDWVKQGQPLLTLECAEVGDAMSEYFKAVANHELARLSLAREQQLAADGIGARKNLVAAETDHKVALASVEAAEKRLHILGFSEDQVQEIAHTHKVSPAITLHAPIAGKVVTSQAVVGAIVDSSKEVLTIVDPHLLWVDAEVYEKDAAKVRTGQEVELVVTAFPEEGFRGAVTYVGGVIDDETRTLTVRTEVQNPDDRLKPGMFADVSLFYERGGPVLAVPLAAILEEGRQQIVFVRDQAGFVRREVETGAVHGRYRQIVKGLTQGEEVVVEGNHQLKSKLSEATMRGAHVH